MKHYNLKKAFNRLYWRFGNQKEFKPNQNDLDAVNTIADFVNTAIKDEVDNNKPYVKVYIHLLKVYLNHYKDIQVAQRKVHQILDMPLEYQYKEFANDFNLVEFDNYCENKGIDAGKHPMLMDDSEMENNLKKFEDKTELLDYIQGRFSLEKIKKSLNTQVVASYNQYKDND